MLDDYLEISCNDKSIKILEIQRQGKRPQNINEFMLGSQIKKGSNLNNAEVLVTIIKTKDEEHQRNITKYKIGRAHV